MFSESYQTGQPIIAFDLRRVTMPTGWMRLPEYCRSWIVLVTLDQSMALWIIFLQP